MRLCYHCILVTPIIGYTTSLLMFGVEYRRRCFAIFSLHAHINNTACQNTHQSLIEIDNSLFQGSNHSILFHIYQKFIHSIKKRCMLKSLTFKELSKIVADDNLTFLLLLFFRKIRLCISSESSARQTIHMKCQVLCSLKNENNNNITKCRLLQL